MKYAIICAVCYLALAIAFVNGDGAQNAGRSACKDPSEVGQTYPNHWDPSKYWYCETFGEPAIEMDCPKDTAYMHLLKECIPWPSWVWKKPENPPTLA